MGILSLSMTEMTLVFSGMLLECLETPFICHRKTMGCRSCCHSRVYRACGCRTGKAPTAQGLCSSSLPLISTKWQTCSAHVEISQPPRKLPEVESSKHFPGAIWHSASWSCSSLSFIYLSFACWPSCWMVPGAYLHQGKASLDHSS